MPSGRVHDATTSALLIASAGTLLLERAGAFAEPLNTAAWVGGFVLGWFVGPDLDVDAGNRSYTLVRGFPGLGWAFHKVWTIFWWPYAKLVPHRHPISHAPVLGTLIRLGYIAVWMWLLGRAFSFVLPPLPWHHLWTAALSLALADAAHYFLDKAS